MNDFPEFEGFWWLPDAVDKQMPGRLVSEGDAAKLLLTIDTPDVHPFERTQPHYYDVIHGRTSDGKSISLLNCFHLNSQRSSAGIETRAILVNYVLEGALVPKECSETAFCGFSLKWPTLQRWFMKSGVEVTWGERLSHGFTVSYSPHEPIIFSYKDGTSIAFSFQTDSMPIDGPFTQEIHFSEVVWVSVDGAWSESVEFFIEKVNELVHLFSLFLLDYTQPEEVVLLGTFDEKTMEDGTQVKPHLKLYHSTPEAPHYTGLPNTIDVLIPYDVIDTEFESIIGCWARTAKVISPVRMLYFSAIYGKTQYIESTFLSLAQGAEVLHRRLYGGTYLDKALYDENIAPALTQAVPDEIGKDVKEVIRQRLKYLNEYSLAKRLKVMAKKHQAVVDEYCPDWNKKIRGIVSARNYFTHYPDESEGDAPTIDELVEYKDLLMLILELEMLSVCAIEERVLVEQAKRCQRYRWRFSRTRGK